MQTLRRSLVLSGCQATRQTTGATNIIFAGIVLLFICILAALAGTELLNFWAALFLLGVGWNGSIPFLVLAAAATLWLIWQRRTARP